jgi:hypothetical protein
MCHSAKGYYRDKLLLGRIHWRCITFATLALNPKYQFSFLAPPYHVVAYSAASLALLLFLGFPAAFFSTGARNFPV